MSFVHLPFYLGSLLTFKIWPWGRSLKHLDPLSDGGAINIFGGQKAESVTEEGVGEGSPGYHPRKFLEKFWSKSCILVNYLVRKCASGPYILRPVMDY